MEIKLIFSTRPLPVDELLKSNLVAKKITRIAILFFALLQLLCILYEDLDYS